MKKILKLISNLIDKLIGTKITKVDAEKAYEWTNTAKRALSGNFVTWLVRILPGDADKIAVETLLKMLPRIASILYIYKEYKGATGAVDVEAIGHEIARQYNVADDKAKQLLYSSIAAELNYAYSDGKLTMGEAYVIAEAEWKRNNSSN